MIHKRSADQDPSVLPADNAVAHVAAIAAVANAAKVAAASSKEAAAAAAAAPATVSYFANSTWLCAVRVEG